MGLAAAWLQEAFVNCTTQIEGTKGTIKLDGRFTFDAGASFKIFTQALLTDTSVSELHLDFSGVTSMESSALGVLLLLRERTEAKGVKIVVLDPNPEVRAALDAVRFGTIFDIRG